MNTKILPYFRSQFWRLFVILFTAPSFSVRKFVFTLFTSFDYLLNHFALLFERQLKEVRRLRRALRRARTASGLWILIINHCGIEHACNCNVVADFNVWRNLLSVSIWLLCFSASWWKLTDEGCWGSHAWWMPKDWTKMEITDWSCMWFLRWLPIGMIHFLVKEHLTVGYMIFSITVLFL